MDITLEFVDTFLFDSIYAKLHPARLPYNLESSNVTNWQSVSPWQYKPSNSFLTFTPRQEAYMSAWPRDNLYRQTITLYLITWWVLISLFER